MESSAFEIKYKSILDGSTTAPKDCLEKLKQQWQQVQSELICDDTDHSDNINDDYESIIETSLFKSKQNITFYRWSNASAIKQRG